MITYIIIGLIVTFLRLLTFSDKHKAYLFTSEITVNNLHWIVFKLILMVILFPILLFYVVCDAFKYKHL